MFYHKISEVISYHSVFEANEVFDGEIELDERYFGGHHKGKRGLETSGKMAVLGILKWQGKSSLTAEFIQILIGAMMLLM